METLQDLTQAMLREWPYTRLDPKTTSGQSPLFDAVLRDRGVYLSTEARARLLKKKPEPYPEWPRPSAPEDDLASAFLRLMLEGGPGLSGAAVR